MKNQNPEIFLEFADESNLIIADLSGFPALITLHHKREPLVIKATDYRGNRRISLRYHFLDKQDEVWRPGRRGIEIPLGAARLVARAINEIMDLLEAEKD